MPPLSLSVGGEAWPSCVSGPPARPAATRVPHPWPWKRVERPHALQPSLAAARSRYAIVASASRPPPAPLCVPEGCLSLIVGRLLAARSATVLTVPSSRPACARAAQSGWPGAAARHPTPACPGAPASRPARGWGGVRWPPQPSGCMPDGTVAKERLKFLYAPLAWALSLCGPNVSDTSLRIPSVRGIIPASNAGHRNPWQSE